ncbi:MAG: metallophosphoesterase [Chloroflexi bacterium]|nr:metallophosphoesterase [Chloroflexota bacterium]MCH8892254.1 metallophosphoesterase [Chloroflexota bacterium]MCI0789436.1 metallophosphoesterase [Chloroflexota bacterium]MCI0830543.1 metallophosphoesterase [Chloroflexota bacterium]MCI0862955.1 metallophosphoesterase [Chloroflexota bacterium]
MLSHKLRLIHTSDIHLGDATGHPESTSALTAVVDAVSHNGADMLLLVGDVFDNERVSDEILEWFLGEIGRLQTPAVLLPGNHDLIHESSVYRRDPFKSAPDNLFIFRGAQGELLSFPGMGIDLWGRAMPMHTPDFKPLEGMPSPVEDNWLVALAHGHFHYEEDRDQRSSPIYPQEVADAGCHYLALGHWDRHVDVSQGNVTAVYSGCPLGPIGSPGAGEVTVVDLDPQTGVSFRQVAIN